LLKRCLADSAAAIGPREREDKFGTSKQQVAAIEMTVRFAGK
jgi:hypothetical protein